MRHKTDILMRHFDVKKKGPESYSIKQTKQALTLAHTYSPYNIGPYLFQVFYWNTLYLLILVIKFSERRHKCWWTNYSEYGNKNTPRNLSVFRFEASQGAYFPYNGSISDDNVCRCAPCPILCANLHPQSENGYWSSFFTLGHFRSGSLGKNCIWIPSRCQFRLVCTMYYYLLTYLYIFHKIFNWPRLLYLEATYIDT